MITTAAAASTYVSIFRIPLPLSERREKDKKREMSRGSDDAARKKIKTSPRTESVDLCGDILETTDDKDLDGYFDAILPLLNEGVRDSELKKLMEDTISHHRRVFDSTIKRVILIFAIAQNDAVRDLVFSSSSSSSPYNDDLELRKGFLYGLRKLTKLYSLDQIDESRLCEAAKNLYLHLGRQRTEQ